MSSMEETAVLDLDWDLLNHLAVPNSVDRLRAERVTEDLIEDEHTAEVYNWVIEHAREHGKSPTAVVIEDEYPDVGELEDPQTVIDDLIGRLRLRYVKNQGRDSLDDLIEQYTDDPTGLVERMRQKTQHLEEMTRKRGDLYTVEDVDRSIKQYDKMAMAGKGPSLGYEEIDDHFHGQRGITYMVGPPKSMKSWMTARSLISNIAHGKKVVEFSLELPAYEADARIRCMAADIPWWKYLKGALSPTDRQTFRDVSDAMADAGRYWVYHPDHGERNIDVMIDKAMIHEPDVIFLDQLQYVETASGRSVGAKNDTGDYWEVCNKLRDYSDDVPIWVVHQFNRSVMNAEELPSMQQIKGSAALEETGTLVLGLHATKDMRSSNVVQMGTLASRNYEWLTWSFNVHFNRACSIDMAGLVTD